MKKFILFFVILLSVLVSQSQITVNANSVISFSSEYPPTYTNEYAAVRTLGAQSTTACEDDGSKVWLAATQNGTREFLELGIPVVSGATQVKVYEQYTSGKIDTLYVRNSLTGLWVNVYQTTAVESSTCPNTLTVNFSALAYPINAVRIAINNLPAGNNWVEIDAIDVTGLAVLSVKLTTFTGNIENGTPVLNWTTENEKNNSTFEVQYSADGRNFTTTGTVAAKNLPGTNTYRYSDVFQSVRGTVYYRLKITDRNGSVSYSNIVKMSANATDISVYPNPTSSFVAVSGISKVNQIQLINRDGRVVLTRSNNAAVATIPVADLPNGVYYLKLFSGTKAEVRKITVAH